MDNQSISRREVENLKTLRNHLGTEQITAPVINQVLGFMAEALLEKDAYGAPALPFVKAVRLNTLLHSMERSDVEMIGALANPENRRHLTSIAQQLFAHADQNMIGVVGHPDIMQRMAAGVFPQQVVAVVRPPDERIVGDQTPKLVSRPS